MDVRTALSIEPRQALSVRVRALDRMVEAEVIDASETPRLRIHSVIAGLREEHFREGVDLETVQLAETYTLERVEVERFDPDRRMLVLRGPIVMRHVRRRTNYREPARLEVRVSRMRGSRLSAESPEPSESTRARTVDVGGGGVAVEAAEPFPVRAGQNARLDIEVDGEDVVAIARTAWVRPKGDGYEAGFAFVQVEGRAHDRLYRFLYNLQRSRMR